MIGTPLPTGRDVRTASRMSDHRRAAKGDASDDVRVESEARPIRNRIVCS